MSEAEEGEEKPKDETEIETGDEMRRETSMEEEAIRLRQQGLTVRQVTQELQKKGYDVSRATVGRWLRGLIPGDSQSGPILKEDSAQPDLILPPELQTPGELKETLKAIKETTAIKRERARGVFFDRYISGLEGSLTQKMESGETPSYKDVVTLMMLKSLQNPGQSQQSTSDAIQAAAALMGSVVETVVKLMPQGRGSSDVEILIKGMELGRGNQWTPEQVIAYQNAQAELQRQQGKDQAMVKTLDRLPQIIEAAGNIIKGTKSTPQPTQTRIKCPNCSVIFGVPPTLQRGIPVACPQCGQEIPQELLTFAPEGRPSAPATMSIPCKCGELIHVTANEAAQFPESIECDKCGMVHRKKEAG